MKVFTSDFTIAFKDEEEYGKLLTQDEVKGRIKNYYQSYVENFDNKIKDNKQLTQDKIKGLMKDWLKDYVEDFDNKTKVTRGEIKDYVKYLVEDFNNKMKVETKQVTNKAIKTGIVFGAIAGLAVGVGCFAAGAALPILAIAGIAVAAAVLVGLVAGNITYAVSKPSSELDRPDLDKEQQTPKV